MEESEFISRLTEIFRAELDQDDLTITSKTRQADLVGWDSLAHVRLVIGFENEFGVQLEATDIEKIKSVADFRSAYDRLIVAA